MRAYYRGSVSEFLGSSPDTVIGKLEDGLAAEGFNRTPEQRVSWRRTVQILRDALTGLRASFDMTDWGLVLEYPIPGRQKRVDAVLLNPRGIFVIEFKGKTGGTSGDKSQLLEYCWNIRDFHRVSAGRPIAPILVPTELATGRSPQHLIFTDIRKCLLTLQVAGGTQLAEAVAAAYEALPGSQDQMSSIPEWDDSRISPSQTIIEATRELFGKHSVREIEHSHSDTDDVVDRVAEIVRQSQTKPARSICFVTGVPGAGKTLVGLRVAYRSEATALAESAPCFASGNVKLLKVLGKALGINVAKSRKDIRQKVHDLTAPLWDVHKFARMHLADASGETPSFRVVVFDEAQRVWTAAKVAKSTRQRAERGNRGPELPDELINCSEPEHLLQVMERFEDWCVVVALVGGGQEIHDGEAGLEEWGRVLRSRLDKWEIWASADALHGGESVSRQCLFKPVVPAYGSIHEDDGLHLKVTKRSFRAECLTEWVNAVLDGDERKANRAAHSLEEFRVELARDLTTARKRLREMTQDDQRIGLLASSGAKRLRAEGVEVQKQFRDAYNWSNWFLAPADHLDASNQLEVAATEFECQGLELDHTCVCWGTDLMYFGLEAGWRFRPSRGKRLAEIKASDEGSYVLNKYRVLLTRAREGLMLFVPRGSPTDPMRPPDALDSTADFLSRCGATPIGEQPPCPNELL